MFIYKIHLGINEKMPNGYKELIHEKTPYHVNQSVKLDKLQMGYILLVGNLVRVLYNKVKD